jgi:hypothetical protein
VALSWLYRLLKQSRSQSQPSRKKVRQNRFVLNLEALGAPLNKPDRSTFYVSGPRGYTDYPALGDNAETADEKSLAVA